MFTSDIPLRVITLLILTAILFTTGPSLSDFDTNSLIQYTVFYANLFVFFFAGVFMRGAINRRYCLVIGFSIILCHFTFYSFLSLAGDNVYLKVWSFFVATIPLYVGLTFFTYFQAKLLNLLERIGVKNETADKIVGPVGTTNLAIIFSGYAAFWIFTDFLLAVYCSAYGFVYGLPHDQLITDLFIANGHFNAIAAYDAVILLVDAFFTILMGYRAIVDQKRPDALGVGPTMTFDASKALRI
ncbi:MAG: hypothetical protein CL600_04170 [Alteromonas sp.]|nr:hypothetical protein [Alteromonas sp.]